MCHFDFVDKPEAEVFDKAANRHGAAVRGWLVCGIYWVAVKDVKLSSQNKMDI